MIGSGRSWEEVWFLARFNASLQVSVFKDSCNCLHGLARWIGPFLSLVWVL